MLKYNFYIDEAGHTGDDLINKDQLFFTMGAIGIPIKDAVAIETMIQTLKAKYRIDFELKGKKLIGTKFEPIIPEIFNELFTINFLPVFTVLEKRYMAAAKIIENLFDPAYNDNTDNSWTFPIPQKAVAANYFYNTLSPSTIDLTSIAMQKGKLADIEQAYELICLETRNPTYSNILKGAAAHLAELSDTLIAIAQDNSFQTRGPVLNSPNYTIYYEDINKIEHLLRQRKVKGDLVFDSSREFNEPFKILFEQVKNIKKRTKMRFPDQTLWDGLTNLVSFEHKDSKDSVFIQLADILATAVNSFFRKLERHDSLWVMNKNDEFWIGYIYILLEHDFGNWIISDQLKQKYGGLIREFIKRSK